MKSLIKINGKNRLYMESMDFARFYVNKNENNDMLHIIPRINLRLEPQTAEVD